MFLQVLLTSEITEKLFHFSLELTLSVTASHDSILSSRSRSFGLWVSFRSCSLRRLGVRGLVFVVGVREPPNTAVIILYTDLGYYRKESKSKCKEWMKFSDSKIKQQYTGKYSSPFDFRPSHPHRQWGRLTLRHFFLLLILNITKSCLGELILRQSKIVCMYEPWIQY